MQWSTLIFLSFLVLTVSAHWFEFESKEKKTKKPHPHPPKNPFSHKRSSSSSDSSDSREKTSSRRSTSPKPTTIHSSRRSRSTTPSAVISRSPEARETTTAPIVTETSAPITQLANCQAASTSIKTDTDTGFIYNEPKFKYSNDNKTLTIVCEGYYAAFISAELYGGQETIFENPVDSSDDALISTSTTLQCEEFGWGAKDLSAAIKNNSFYCFVNSPQQDGPTCKCNNATIWVDVMILFESSLGTTNMGLQEMFAYAQTSLDWLNIQKTGVDEQLYTRIGIITYGSEPTLVSPLGTLNGTELMDIDELPYNPSGEPMLGKAIHLATGQLLSSSDIRPVARKVIAVFATSYNPWNDDALIKSKHFQESGGTMFVYDFVEEHSIGSDDLQVLASPGYFYNFTLDEDGTALVTSLCNANCFCSPDYVSYSNNSAGTPLAGCYHASYTAANFRLALKVCKKSNGTIAQGKTLKKTQFLKSFYNGPSKIWAGFQWDEIKAAYYWLDNTPVANTTMYYNPWNKPDPGRQEGQDCAVINENGLWEHTVCQISDDSYNYVCEIPPCDSTRYCDLTGLEL